MNTTVTLALKGHQFAATLTGSPVKGAVAIFRDGKRLASIPWNEEGFIATGHDLGFADIDDAADVYDALRRSLLEKTLGATEAIS